MNKIEKLEWACRLLTDRLNYRCRILSSLNCSFERSKEENIDMLRNAIFEDFEDLATHEDLLLEKDIYSGTEFKLIQ